MKNIYLCLVFLAANCVPAAAQRSEVSAKLSAMADTLTTAYAKTAGAPKKPKAAVFSFDTTEELARQRIGFAVSELLSHKLSEKGAFSLFERTDLNLILNELKLSMAGVTSPDDALKAGKLSSADILVLGSVAKFGALYHVNARIVRVEDGEVIATAYESLPVSAVETEAKDYITLVPKSQAIGIYFLYDYRLTVNSGARQASSLTYGFTDVTGEPRQVQLGLIGVGVRYTPKERIMLDFAFTHSGTAVTTYKLHYAASSGSDYSEHYRQNFAAVRALAGFTGRPGRTFSYFLGAGATSEMIYGDDGGGKTSYTTPTVLARGEYHPQERIGLSLALGYDLVTKSAYVEHWILGKVPAVKLQQLYVEPTIAIYF